MTPEATVARDEDIERVSDWGGIPITSAERELLRKAWEFGAQWASEFASKEIDLALNG